MSGCRCTNGAFQGLSLIRNCHPERSEGPASRGEQQVLRFAQDDKV